MIQKWDNKRIRHVTFEIIFSNYIYYIFKYIVYAIFVYFHSYK